MRALFTLLGVFLLAAAVWFGVRHCDTVYCRMELNRAIHEYSIHKEREAVGQVLALLKRKPKYRPALERAVSWLAEGGEFERALSLSREYATTRSLSPRARYDLGVCAYETGEEEAARALFESLGAGDGEQADYPAPLVSIYLDLARGDLESARLLLVSADSRFEGNLFYHSLFGRVCYIRGEIARASAELGRAVELGERNPRARLMLAVCRALEGDRPGMGMLLDQLEAEGRNAYADARSEIESRLERLQSRRGWVSPSERQADRERVLNLRLALAAIDLRVDRSDEALREIASLRKDYPERVGLATRQGLIFEEMGDLDRALRAFRSEADDLLLAAYRAAGLAEDAPTTADAEVLGRFLPDEALVFDARELNPSVGGPADRGWNLFASGDFSTTFTLGSTGRYAIDLIARADEAGGVWPIVSVYLDGERIGDLYIDSPVWDLFESRADLLSGDHTLRLFYTNNAVAPGVEGDRNFYLDKLIIRPEPR